MPDFAQLPSARARIQTQKVGSRALNCYVMSWPLRGHLALYATSLSFTFLICEMRITLPPP